MAITKELRETAKRWGRYRAGISWTFEDIRDYFDHITGGELTAKQLDQLAAIALKAKSKAENEMVC